MPHTICRIIYISIHAPLRGATKMGSRFSAGQTFQSTPLCEGRPRTTYLVPVLFVISIHAPLRGATVTGGGLQTIIKHFNPRPSARGDLSPPFRAPPLPHFNPRPSARGDPAKTVSVGANKKFQSTPLCEGRRESA